MTTAKINKKSIRYKKNQWHPYGWEVAFSARVTASDGTTGIAHFRDIGVNRAAAIRNSLRLLSNIDRHPDIFLK